MDIMQVITRTNANMQQNELDINEQDTSFKTFLLANEKEDVNTLSTNEKENVNILSINEKELMVESDEEETTNQPIGEQDETYRLDSLVKDKVYENIDISMFQPTIHMFLANSDTTIDLNVQQNMSVSKNTLDDFVGTSPNIT